MNYLVFLVMSAAAVEVGHVEEDLHDVKGGNMHG